MEGRFYLAHALMALWKADANGHRNVVHALVRRIAIEQMFRAARFIPVVTD